MRKLRLIGIGTGDPEQLTLQAVAALRDTTVVFALDKGETKEDLLRVRRDICERFIGAGRYRFVTAADVVRDPHVRDYGSRVDQWHQERATLYESLLLDAMDKDEVGALLVWGDPALYDSTLRILRGIRERGRVAFELEVLPGLSSIQLLAARHQLVFNRIGGEILITTGRRLRAGWPATATDIIVMLDGHGVFAGIEADCDIYWGAYLGSPDEILRSGRLCEVKDEILALREAARARKGWIMDTYLLSLRNASDHPTGARHATHEETVDTTANGAGDPKLNH